MFGLSAGVFALIKFFAIFACILVGLRMHMPLYLCIFFGSAFVALITPLSPLTLFNAHISSLGEPSFIILMIIVFLVVTLAEVQQSTGQNKRFVEGLEKYLRLPRLRLILFPALVGLLPMPGGALFSCPMLDAAAHNAPITTERKAAINYWFRHIWESTWPLYPGYILASSLLGLPLSRLLQFTWPILLINIFIGWIFLVRDIKIPAPDPSQSTQDITLGKALVEGLPLLVTLLGGVALIPVWNALAPQFATQGAFASSLTAAIATSLYQGHKHLNKPLIKIFFSKTVFNIVLILLCIFGFKETIFASGIITPIADLGTSRWTIYALFLILPFMGGMITGIMVGFVGSTFPLLLALVAHSGLEQELLPLALLGLCAGNLGQMLSPMHVCLVVTCQYFHLPISRLWALVPRPILCQMGLASLWILYLYHAKAQF